MSDTLNTANLPPEWQGPIHLIIEERESLRSQLAEANRKLQEAGLDTKRIDYLQDNNLTVYTCWNTEKRFLTDGSRNFEEKHIFEGWSVNGNVEAIYLTIREAIDATLSSKGSELKP